MDEYLAEGTAELALPDHVDTASPANVLMIALGQNEYLSLLTAQQASRLGVQL